MSLVAYGSSDESDTEEVNEIESNDKNDDFAVSSDLYSSNVPTEEKNEANIKPAVKIGSNSSELTQTKTNKLFSTLPSPRNTFSIPDNTFKLLSKKQPVKIVLPSLSEIKTDEDERKKRKPSTKGSGLFALLPAPKSGSSLVPNAVKNRTVPAKVIPKKLPMPLKKSPLPSALSNKKLVDDDEDDEILEKPESFFFSSADVKPDEMLPVDIPDIIPKAHISAPSSSEDVIDTSNQPATVMPSESSSTGYFLPEASNGMEVNDINDEAIEKLCGVGAKKRKGLPDEIIDINVDSIVGDAYMWLSQDLTVEQEHSGFKKPKNLSVVERRKHQITYLASQAKEKELELRNQWANSRMTRKQTQSKYGF